MKIKSYGLGTVLKSAFLSFRYQTKELRTIPIICTSGSRLVIDRASLIIKGRLRIGVKVTALSVAHSLIEVRSGASLLVDGRVSIGPGVIIIVNKNARLSIGDGTYIAADSKVYVNNEVTIGEHCALSWNLTIIDTDFHNHSTNGVSEVVSAPIHIGNNVWIGCNVTLLKGITIGDGSIVAAGSVVTNNVLPGSLVAGNPAKTIRTGVAWSD